MTCLTQIKHRNFGILVPLESAFTSQTDDEAGDWQAFTGIQNRQPDTHQQAFTRQQGVAEQPSTNVAPGIRSTLRLGMGPGGSLSPIAVENPSR